MRRMRTQCIGVLALLAVVSCPCLGQSDHEKTQALKVLEQYVHLRLQNADWKNYSRYITWPDEPSWDCYWVVKNYDVGIPAYAVNAATIPITYRRLGLSCNNFNFEAKSGTVTIRYQLVRVPRGWKVDGPIPDYPDVKANVLVKELNDIARNSKEMPERRSHASAEARIITSVLDGAN
jgi:hypothetical protein